MERDILQNTRPLFDQIVEEYPVQDRREVSSDTPQRIGSHTKQDRTLAGTNQLDSRRV
jgi:hypothetical protein